MPLERNIKLQPGELVDLFARSGVAKGVATKLTLISDHPVEVFVQDSEPVGGDGHVPLSASGDSYTLLDTIKGCWVKAHFGAELNFSENFSADSFAGGGSGINIPSDQIFNSTVERDSYFVANPTKLIEGAQCVVLTNHPEGLYQVYTSDAWQDRAKVVTGPKGDPGDPSLLIDDSASKADKSYSSKKIEDTFAKIDDSLESEDTVYSSQKTKELIDSSNPIYSGKADEVMKLDENGDLVPSGVLSRKDGSLSLSSGSVDIGPHTISSGGEGIEATNDSSGESYNFVFAGQGDDTGPVDRILGGESVIKTTEDLSLQLTNHTSKITATADVRIIKKPVTIKPVSPQTNVTMQVTDLNGSDIWTYGPFDIAIDDNGDFKFTISTVLDFKIGEYLVTFLSPDGDVTLYGGASPISGERTVYGELPFKPFHDETLHNIKTGGETVREIEAGENVTAEVVKGKLRISSTGSTGASNYVEKYSKAELDKLYVAHKGKYGDNRDFYPVELSQDVNGWTQLGFTENMIFKSKDKDTGAIGDKVLEVKSGKVVSHKDFEVLGNAIYDGDTSQPANLINRKALDNHVSTGIDEKIAEDKAKGEWIGGVFKDTINDDGNPEDDFTCSDPKQWLEYRKTAFNGPFALTVNQGQDLISSEIVIHLHISSSMTSAPFKVVTNDGKEVTRTIRVGEKWRFYLRSGAAPYFELIDDGMQSGVTDSSFDGEGFGVPASRNVSSGLVTQEEITGNWRNNSADPGDLKINLLSTSGVNNWRFYYTFPLGTLNSRKLIVQVDDKPATTKTVRSGESWLCEVKGGRFYDDFFWQKIIDNQSTFVSEEDLNHSIDEINNKLLTKVSKSDLELAVDTHTNDYLATNLASLVDARMNAKEIKSPFMDAQSVQIDTSHLDHPDVTVYVTDGTKLKKVKPAISKDLVSGLLQVDFINPKSGLIVVRSH